MDLWGSSTQFPQNKVGYAQEYPHFPHSCKCLIMLVLRGFSPEFSTGVLTCLHAFSPSRVPVLAAAILAVVFVFPAGTLASSEAPPPAPPTVSSAGSSAPDLATRLLDFVLLRQPAVRHAVVACLILGLMCGVLGAFLLVRRMALVGDALGHAVLPGVCVGFLLSGDKASITVVVCATVAGLLGMQLISAIPRTTRIKPDAALALVLSCFFGAGIVLLGIIEELPQGNKAGLKNFLFGQAAAVGPHELLVMATATAAMCALLFALYKEVLISSFDEAYAWSLGVPTTAVRVGINVLLTLTVVISIQAVGVILVCALLVIPAATAGLLCRRMPAMLLTSASVGMISGLIGAFVSYMGPGLPTGPFVVVTAAGFFAMAWMFAPRHGLVSRFIMQRRQKLAVEIENTLKAIYQLRERAGFLEPTVTAPEIARQMRIGTHALELRLRNLERRGLALVTSAGVELTRDGFVRACEVVRNHRLWELYLVNEASIAADHVHDDAERIEHILGPEVVARLEQKLQYPRFDPHGKPIPSLRDLELTEVLQAPPPRAPHEVLLGRYQSSGNIR